MPKPFYFAWFLLLFIYRFSLHSWHNRIRTNGLGIIRHIAFLDDNFKAEHLEINLEKKSDSPDEDKSIGDTTSLKSVLSDYFSLHPDFHTSYIISRNLCGYQQTPVSQILSFLPSYPHILSPAPHPVLSQKALPH